MPTDMDTVTKEYYQRVKMTHTQQVEIFGWCICEGEQGHISEGCPTYCYVCPENIATHMGIMTLQGEIALCDTCYNS